MAGRFFGETRGDFMARLPDPLLALLRQGDRAAALRVLAAWIEAEALSPGDLAPLLADAFRRFREEQTAAAADRVAKRIRPAPRVAAGDPEALARWALKALQDGGLPSVAGGGALPPARPGGGGGTPPRRPPAAPPP